MGVVKEFFDQFSRVTDILNLGRLIFYTAAGALIVFPAFMTGRLLIEPSTSISGQMAGAGAALAKGPVQAVLFLASMVVGFLIATAGFPVVLDGLSDEIRRQMAQEAVGSASYSFPRNYPLLRSKSDDDYAAWLISEYYRYVEIATYIPLGAIGGLVLAALYLLLFLLKDSARPGAAGLTSAHLAFLVVLTTLALIRYWLWPEVWAKRVVVPTIRTYLSAKKNLIDGVNDERARAAQRAASKPV